jgi:ATP-dependent exoDNAse (exonuclease V) beta subunit
MLDVNYRSNELIMQWSNKMFYGGKLTSHPRNESIHLSDITSNRQNPQAKTVSNCYRPHHLGQERRNYGETESKY